ncbi:MAG: hypothetical protein M3R49_05630 [Chloroflexota bacterium]|nr:hypothetical protein [Chloroflexota bacterium]
MSDAVENQPMSPSRRQLLGAAIVAVVTVSVPDPLREGSHPILDRAIELLHG